MKLILPLGWRSAFGAVPALPPQKCSSHALHGVVVAGDVATDEGRRVRERHVEVRRDRALFFRGLDEGVEVVADHFRHAGGRDRDHLGLVHVVGVGKPVDHVVEAAEHRRVFCHRRGNRGGRLLEVTREMAAIVGNAALAAVNEGKRALETQRSEHRTERLASLGRVDDKRFASEVLLLIFRRL